jgi:hypothetical protein
MPVVRTVYQRPKISAVAKVPCAVPVTIPSRRLTDKETGELWGTDRQSLRICEYRRAAGVAAGE